MSSGTLKLVLMTWLVSELCSSEVKQSDKTHHTTPLRSNFPQADDKDATSNTREGSATPGHNKLGSVSTENTAWTNQQDTDNTTLTTMIPRSPHVTNPCRTQPYSNGVLSTMSDDIWAYFTAERISWLLSCWFSLYHQDSEDCQLQLKVSEGSIMKIEVCSCLYIDITIQQYDDNGERFYPDLLKNECRDFSENVKDLYSLTSGVVLQIKSLHSWSQFMFNFTVANKSDAPGLEVTYLSPSLGRIQTQETFQNLIDCITVNQPSGHGIFLSKTPRSSVYFLRMFFGQCGQKLDNGKTLELFPVLFPDFLTSHNNDRRGNTHDQNQDLPMTLLVSQKWHNYMVKFTLYFSFYRNTSKPQQFGQRWNCSVSVWPDLYRHFAVCNLVGECVDAEDEADCPYTSTVYGPGYIEAGDSQIFLADGGPSSKYLEGPQSYRAMERDCIALGAQPVSYHSPREWTVILGAVSGGFIWNLWIGLHQTRLSLENMQDNLYIKNMYKDTWQWSSGAIAYYLHPSFVQNCPRTAHMTIYYTMKPQIKTLTTCSESVLEPDLNSYRLCKVPNPSKHSVNNIVIEIKLNVTASPVSLVSCPMEHLIHAMFVCDQRSLCAGRVEARGMSYTVMCRISVTQTVPYFTCLTTGEHVPYSAVCDWRQDCGDNSDESFCQFPACGHNSYDCGRGQCIPEDKVCDRQDDCKTLTDESLCEDKETVIYFNVTTPPALVNFDRLGSFTVIPLPGNITQCPDTHYQCPGDGYCLPVYTRCNDMNDCPHHEDEAGCDVYTCKGLYRCNGLDRTICLHGNHLCDGWAQCPQQDDELMCGMAELCPDQCVCYGMHLYRPETALHLRYIEGRGTGLTSDVIANHTLLIHLGVGACGWRNISGLRLINLHMLDLSDNLFQTVNFKDLAQLKNLQELVLVSNPLSTRFPRIESQSKKLRSLLLLNLSRVPNQYSNLHIFSHFMPRVQILDLSQTGITSLKEDGLFRYLNVLDLRGCPLSEFVPSFMKAMNNLKHVSGDNFKLCCSAVLPDDFPGKCIAPVDEISSCENLLKSGFYGVILAVFALLALSGNLGSFVYRLTMFSAGRKKVGFLVFVIHLSMSDFLMGIYLSILGVMDRLYAGSYMWKEMEWKRSIVCHTAGFLSLLSCEVSSFIICLITLDRFLVIRFPFSHLCFGTTSAQVACGIIWGLGVILASIPLLPVTSHWAFYSQTGICIPLPVTRADFPGSHYSFAVMIVVNLVMFLLIAIGQVSIYWSVRANTMSKDMTNSKDDVVNKDKSRSKEFTIARRLLVIAMSDFLCWFPIGVCGLLAKLDIPVPGEVNTAMATIVLPVNAALNPFLYTYTILRKKRQKEKKASLQNFIIAQVKSEMAGSRH